MESRGEAVSSEKLAAIEDEEVLNQMVSRTSFGYFRSASVVCSLQAQVKWGKSGLHAGKEVQRLKSTQTSWLICFTLKTHFSNL